MFSFLLCDPLNINQSINARIYWAPLKRSSQRRLLGLQVGIIIIGRNTSVCVRHKQKRAAKKT